MTQGEFVSFVRDCFVRTGLQPLQCHFYQDRDGVRRGCAVGAIVLAHETLPADAHSMDWMGKAEAILHESFDFIEGITCGFDGGNPGDGEESEFNRGVGYGRAVAQAMHLCTGPEAAAVISSAAELPAINQMTESETPLAIPF